MNRMMLGSGALLLALSACRSAEPETHQPGVAVSGDVVTVTAAPTAALLEAAGTAAPYADATLATKLMGTVTAVHVREGDVVRAGQPLVTIDARDLTAKRAQVEAGRAEAEAMRREALSHAERMRALYAEEAAPKAQLDAAETGLARAEAAVRSAAAAAAEVSAVSDYAVVRAPFAGVVVSRMVDPGAFAAPGAPLVRVQDGSRLRVSVTVAPDAVREVRRGSELAAHIDRRPASAIVEGVVPAAGGHLYTVNAIVDNREGRFLSGSAATLALPQGMRTAITVPFAAVRREGDLTGVYVRDGEATDVRWVRLGRQVGDGVEVLSGLRDGEQVVVPAAPGAH